MLAGGVTSTEVQYIDKQEQIIVSLIPHGAEQPISLAELARLSGMDGRQLRSLLYHLITVHHVPIGGLHGNNSGYFLITNENERAAALHPLLSQVKELRRRINTIESMEL